jgi:hypothetical protein
MSGVPNPSTVLRRTMNEPNDLPDLKEVLTGDLLVPGHWVVASLTMENFWPTKVQKLNWRGADFWIIPTTKGSHPAIATRVPSPTGREERETLLMRFICKRDLMAACEPAFD